MTVCETVVSVLFEIFNDNLVSFFITTYSAMIFYSIIIHLAFCLY